MGLRLAAILLNKCLKAFPIADLIPTALLKVRNRSTTAGVLFAFEPQVKRIATDVEHLADIGFAFTTSDRSYRFRAQIATIRGGHKQFMLHFMSLLYVLISLSRAIQPTINNWIALGQTSAHRFKRIKSGSKVRPANRTRSSINQTGPNIGAAIRMNRKEPPHSAAKSRSSVISETRIAISSHFANCTTSFPA